MSAAKPPVPWIAVALSMLAPGLGQLYAGSALRAAAWFAGAAAGLAGTLSWVLSESRCAPAEGAAWFAALFVFQIGSWFDAHRFARRNRRAGGGGSAPAVAAALSVLFPGLGHAYVYGGRLLFRILLAPVFTLPAVLLMLGESIETAPVPGWPEWLAGWPEWLTVAAGAALSGGAVVHAYAASFSRRRHAPRLPRLKPAIWAIALAAWASAQLPWESRLRDRVKSFKIPSASMRPTLVVGDRIWAKRAAGIARGDVIVFRPPDRPDTDYVKRVVALPGETIRIEGKTVYVNGSALAEPYTVFTGEETFGYAGRDFLGALTLPPGHFFVLGDNRDNSRDSRFFGPVPRENIFGRAYKRFWPPARSGPLKTP